ncbi:MAG: hypothetical protein KF773_12330 [Deltaproteobacteria bacterium]|nr:hypothetical protein [Deltaproteobacteria bacterium]
MGYAILAPSGNVDSVPVAVHVNGYRHGIAIRDEHTAQEVAKAISMACDAVLRIGGPSPIGEPRVE